MVVNQATCAAMCPDYLLKHSKNSPFPLIKLIQPVKPTTVYTDKPYQLSIVAFSLYYQLGRYEC